MFDNNPALTREAVFDAGEAAISKAITVAHEFVAECAAGADAQAKLAIVVEELVANIVEHGACAPGSTISLRLSALGGDIGVTLSDEGCAFDPRLAERPDAPPERGGGAGLALVRRWARIVDYSRADGRNLLTLVIPGHA